MTPINEIFVTFGAIAGFLFCKLKVSLVLNTRFVEKNVYFLFSRKWNYRQTVQCVIWNTTGSKMRGLLVFWDVHTQCVSAVFESLNSRWETITSWIVPSVDNHNGFRKGFPSFWKTAMCWSWWSASERTKNLRRNFRPRVRIIPSLRQNWQQKVERMMNWLPNMTRCANKCRNWKINFRWPGNKSLLWRSCSPHKNSWDEEDPSSTGSKISWASCSLRLRWMSTFFLSVCHLLSWEFEHVTLSLSCLYWFTYSRHFVVVPLPADVIRASCLHFVFQSEHVRPRQSKRDLSPSLAVTWFSTSREWMNIPNSSCKTWNVFVRQRNFYNDNVCFCFACPIRKPKKTEHIEHIGFQPRKCVKLFDALSVQLQE